MIVLLTGFTGGLLHVFLGPDHLAAVAPLAVTSRRNAWLAGLRWGVGHTSGVVLVGLVALLLRQVLPLEAISSWSERVVGVMLIGIGLWGLRAAFRRRVHLHAHTHDGQDHVHVHVHDTQTRHTPDEAAPHVHTHTAFAVGTIHGLSGSSHFLCVLPALAFPSATDAFWFMAAYGVGTVGAMTLFAAVVGGVARHCPSDGLLSHRRLLSACSVAAVVLGGYWLAS